MCSTRFVGAARVADLIGDSARDESLMGASRLSLRSADTLSASEGCSTCLPFSSRAETGLDGAGPSGRFPGGGGRGLPDCVARDTAVMGGEAAMN